MTDHDPRTRMVVDWLREDAHENADRVLLNALNDIDHIKQRRPWWPAWRFPAMNGIAKLVAAAAVVGATLLAFALLPLATGPGGPGPAPSPSASSFPVPSPALLARGDFQVHGYLVQLEARGADSSVSGALFVESDSGGFTVDLECGRTTPGGLLVIGGDVKESTNIAASESSRIAIVLRPASPVSAVFYFESNPPAATCQEAITGDFDGEATPALRPITGTVEFGP
jgi:hypothetical protein